MTQNALFTFGGAQSKEYTVKNERERCIAICERWIGSFQHANPTTISPRTWAVDAIEDIIELIRSGEDPQSN